MQNEKEMPVMTVMALYYELPVFKDVYKMTLRIFELTANFSREYKFTLGQALKRDCILLVRSIYRANKHKDIGKQITGWRNAQSKQYFFNVR